jgi:hypothetical protein
MTTRVYVHIAEETPNATTLAENEGLLYLAGTLDSDSLTKRNIFRILEKEENLYSYFLLVNDLKNRTVSLSNL